MDIVMIGTGNTASVLGRKLVKAGHRIIQVYGRDSAEASALAYELGTESTNYWNVVNKNAGLYILAVSDIGIEEVVRELRLKDKTVVHTAASVPMEILKSTGGQYGVFYPLQTLKKEVTKLPDIPLLINASDATTLDLLDELGHSISKNVLQASDETRMKLHLAAIMVNNFTNHLYVLAEAYCKKEGLDFGLLLPLIKETASRIENLSPSQLQTGPASRGDKATMDKHLELLETHPQLQKFYQLFSESIAGSRQ